MKIRLIAAVLLTLNILSFSLADQNKIINPYPRAIVSENQVWQCDFETADQLFKSLHDCSVKLADSMMIIDSVGNDPYLHKSGMKIQGPAIVKVKMKSTVGGSGQIFYTTNKTPGWSEVQSSRFNLSNESGQFMQYSIKLETTDVITALRLDPMTTVGTAYIDNIEIYQIIMSPLEIIQAGYNEQNIEYTIKNHAKDRYIISNDDISEYSIEPGKTLILTETVKAEHINQYRNIAISIKGLTQKLTRPIFLWKPEMIKKDKVINKTNYTAIFDKNVNCLQILINSKPVAIISCTNIFNIIDNVIFHDDAIEVKTNGKDCQLFVHTQGEFQAGLLAGLEYLSKGEISSDTLDDRTASHLRYEPESYKITMPLMICQTDLVSMALSWDNPNCQVSYAVPDFYNGRENQQRMALLNNWNNARILIANPQTPIEDFIIATAKLPTLPDSPRNWQQQIDLCLAAFNGPIKDDGGWRHCAGDHWPVQPYADHASTLWRLTGKIPAEIEKTIVPGGGHINNDSIYFVTNRAKQWLTMKKNAVQNIIISQQQPDGSFRYNGKYRQGHFEDTASGLCALNARSLLDFAYYTGDTQAQAAGLKALQYIRRFQVPRGAQVWEVPLHTPDIMASAHAVHAYTRGYELTGDDELLKQARRWAITGLPFVYMWGDKPVSCYSTIAVYGATNWVAPNWIGLPVQWCGTVFADALLLLSQYDKSYDWRKLALGITIAAEQMQYPDGAHIGCLPDSFELQTQSRRPWDINPTALIILRLKLSDKPAGLIVSIDPDSGKRIIAPYKADFVNGQILFPEAPDGIEFQAILNGTDIIPVKISS
ncbi:MAG: terpene cyclase/mutase family protein [Phycisphaerae bacterium]|nr:terpene cyclase/mutase family protein [Phycisphaerae bacterium]